MQHFGGGEASACETSRSIFASVSGCCNFRIFILFFFQSISRFSFLFYNTYSPPQARRAPQRGDDLSHSFLLYVYFLSFKSLQRILFRCCCCLAVVKKNKVLGPFRWYAIIGRQRLVGRHGHTFRLTAGGRQRGH